MNFSHNPLTKHAFCAIIPRSGLNKIQPQLQGSTKNTGENMNKLSITGTFEKKAELEAQAKKVWTDLAEQLLTLIPDNLEALSSELGFSKIKAPSLEVKITDEMWRFPEWLEYLVTNTKSSPYGCCDNKVKQDQLLDYDCASFDDLKAKLDILQGVWKSLVRIEVDEDELPWLVTIRFYAAEITHQLISDNND